ncbi:hypothetical protein [Parendozoicomonas sp. Alg238-R29]|uniref:hypothetical protein n=1 Tax=Parendozoicomonas sp. Alg238-R29 TaxID=2993446 RepID=UPI00248EB961|nr:hypothetical protein [Parendozoicomonas sp. Alg238-R29]
MFKTVDQAGDNYRVLRSFGSCGLVLEGDSEFVATLDDLPEVHYVEEDVVAYPVASTDEVDTDEVNDEGQ